jgi:putative transposase
MTAQVLTYKYQLRPTPRQYRALDAILEQQRQLYNAALAERIDAYQKGGITIGEGQQSKSLTQIRNDDPAYAMVQRRIQKETLRRLDRAYKAFFRRVKQGTEAPGFPHFKGRDFFDGFGFDAFQQVSFDGKRLRFAGSAGGIRINKDRPVPGKIKGIWFKREARRWYAGLQVEVEAKPQRMAGKDIGVDWGTSYLAVLSTGEHIPNPRHSERFQPDCAAAQRKLARRKRGSKRRLAARAELQRIQRKIRNCRQNTMHKLSARLAKQFRTVAVEKIDARRMLALPDESLPRHLVRRRNRELLDASPFDFRQKIQYKAVREGSKCIVVEAAYSTRECSACGALNETSLAEAKYACSACGCSLPRKVNAARVIKQRGLADGDGPVPGGAKPDADPACLKNTGGSRKAAASGRRPL